MDTARKLLTALVVSLLLLSTVACSAEAGVNEDGAGVKVEGEEGGEGEGG